VTLTINTDDFPKSTGLSSKWYRSVFAVVLRLRGLTCALVPRHGVQEDVGMNSTLTSQSAVLGRQVSPSMPVRGQLEPITGLGTVVPTSQPVARQLSKPVWTNGRLLMALKLSCSLP
jgi:hypothetical protein